MRNWMPMPDDFNPNIHDHEYWRDEIEAEEEPDALAVAMVDAINSCLDELRHSMETWGDYHIVRLS
jgi:hypothetical protein